jgi:ribosome biogenesis protein BMS1
MRLTGTVRRDEQVKTPNKVDSIYKPIVERAEKRTFNRLRVPRKLEAALPFASKTKNVVAGRKDGREKARPTYLQQRAVVLEKEERDAVSLLQQMQAVQKVKVEKRREKAQGKRAEKEKEKGKDEEKKRERLKELKKDGSRRMGQAEAKKQKMR